MLRTTTYDINAWTQLAGATFLTTIGAALTYFALSIANLMVAVKAAYAATSNNDMLDAVAANWTVTQRQWVDQAAAVQYAAAASGEETMVWQWYGPKGTGGAAAVHTCPSNGVQFTQEWRTGHESTLMNGLSALALAPSDTGVITIVRLATGAQANKWQATFVP